MTSEGAADATKASIHEELTEKIIGAAMEVHKALGPGLLESVYEECLCHELQPPRICVFSAKSPYLLFTKGISLDCGYRLDIVVEDTVILELKCVERITSPFMRRSSSPI